METQLTIGNLPLTQALYPFLLSSASTEEKIAAVRTALEGTDGEFWRSELGRWAARMVPVELLVSEVHREWRPLVREAILFVVSKLSPVRLAPKIVEQMALGPEIPAEVRLLRFIAKVPGLQKIGQVLARNRHLHPRLRRALIKLENGICDVSIDEIRAIIQSELPFQMQAYGIKLAPRILSEASVSAVVSFTWRNPATGWRERGAFKVLKPHISSCYAEDMSILGRLARHLARKRHVERLRMRRLAETLTEIRLLLEREVDFPREQATLAGALEEYRSLHGVRIPRLIPALSSSTITALTFERGRKVTQVGALPSKHRISVASRLAEAVLAVPALSRQKDAIFHADPHAGNLLYDKRTNELVILDWALTERLSREQRKSVVLLVLMTVLRDAAGMAKAIEQLCQVRSAEDGTQARTIRTHVDRLLDGLPLTKVPGPMDAMRLLDALALEGARFPAALLMFRKAAFTLEGVVDDIAGHHVQLDSVVASHAMAHWKDAASGLLRLLSPRDWMAVEWSALTFTSRLCARALSRPLRLYVGFEANAETS